MVSMKDVRSSKHEPKSLCGLAVKLLKNNIINNQIHVYLYFNYVKII